MARQYGVEKMNLLGVLVLIAANEGAYSGDLVRQVMETFECSKRAATDAVSILRKAGCVESIPHMDDRRRRRYYLTLRGWQCLVAPFGGMLLRLARQLFTTCGSPRIRRRQDQFRTRDESLEIAFNRAEQSLRNHTLGMSRIENRLATERALLESRVAQ